MKMYFYFIVISVFVLSSCQKELSFETSGTGGTGTGTGTGTRTDCKACAYMPVCNGSYYTYNDTLTTSASIVTDTLQFVKDTTIDSKTFVKIYSPLSDTYSYYNCTDGATRVIAYNNPTIGGSTITADITLIKANLPVGGTWQDSLINPAGQQVIYKNSIVEKGVSRTVNGQTFNDVIHVKSQSGVVIPFIGYTQITESDYYFARGVGPVDILTVYSSTGLTLEHRTIKTYHIP